MESQHLWNNGEFILDSPDDAKEPFLEIRIITLKAHLESLAIDVAMGRGADLSNIDEYVSMILSTELTTSPEFVHVTPEYIQVGVNVDLIDDVVISYVWDMLSRCGDLAPGTKIKLGPLVQVYEKQKSSVDKRAN